MNNVELKLEELEGILKEANAPVLEFFNAGLSDEEIMSFFSNADIPVHPDLLSLYRWHNGLLSIYDRLSSLSDLSPLGAFPNLNEMAALRSDFIRNDYTEIENREEHVPILSGGEDDMHLLKVSTGEIYYSSPGIQVFYSPQFHSLSSMLDFILKCYNDKLLTMDPIEGLVVDEAYWTIRNDYEI